MFPIGDALPPPLMSDGHCTQAERSSEDLAKQRTKLTGDLAAVTLQLDNERRANADHEKAVRRVCGLAARVIGPCRRTCRAHLGGGGYTRTAGGRRPRCAGQAYRGPQGPRIVRGGAQVAHLSGLQGVAVAVAHINDRATDFVPAAT
jgi:hypothetical protein